MWYCSFNLSTNLPFMDLTIGQFTEFLVLKEHSSALQPYLYPQHLLHICGYSKTYNRSLTAVVEFHQ